MKHFLYLIICFFLFNVSIVNSQTPTIGLLKKEAGISEGYTLFSPELNNTSYLINNCGEKIREWTFTDFPGLTAYILENGNILRAGVNSLEMRDWDDNMVWFYDMNANGYNQHHDIEPLPNGNILCLLSEFYAGDTILSLGRDSNITGNNFKLDKIIELEPVGSNSANVVWEWRFIDHFAQDTDPLKPNFFDINMHPELLDINYDGNNDVDYTHVNGIDYNENLDQIILSARHTSEVYIIDHGTTTAEAAGHSGGNAGQGGDFLWRWGNPEVYGGSSSQILFRQHDAKWINNGYLDEGKISVFNNLGDGGNTFSSIHIIDPPLNGFFYGKVNGEFLPNDFFWSWDGSFFGDVVYEGKKSGCQLLENGNAIICETSLGRFSEINRSGELLWSYKNPVGIGTIFNQGVIDANGDNGLFRGEKYPEDYLGFAGKDLSSQGIIENQNSLSNDCIADTISGIGNVFGNSDLIITNPILDETIRFKDYQESSHIKLYDLKGQLIFEKDGFSGSSLFLNQNILAGIYFLSIDANFKKDIFKVLFL